ncbi:MAG: amidohydrolase [Chloroflexota bacterium]
MQTLYNARIYTLDEHTPQAAALQIDQGRVVAILQEKPTSAGKGDTDLQGKVVIPGLIDAHLHLEHYALGLQKVDCETPTRAECLGRVAERARHTPPGEWILGHGWNQNVWPEGFGSAADLDEIAPQHPVYLTAKSLHAAWANHAALRLARISAATPDPPDGRLGRDAQGQPDGILFESAMELAASAIPEPGAAQVEEAIRAALPVLWGMGLTGVHDFDRRRCFLALQSLHQRGELRLRVLKSIPLEDLPHAAALGLRSGFGDDTLRIGSVKLFADGALGPQTAAMLQAYQGDPQSYGMLFLDAEQLYEHGRLAVDSGLSLAVHAIGDRANHEVLNALEQLRAYARAHQPGSAGLRHRIEHVQVLHPDDAGRLAELGVIASMQPIHATSDMEMADRFWGQRAALAYAWRTQLEHGAALAFGSDAPVESPNPFWGLHAAVTRQRANGAPGPQGWYPEQRLSRAEALAAFTLGPAYAAGMEKSQGRLSPGFLADLLVLDCDPFTCPAGDLAAIRPAATMVGGEWVYQL